MRLQAWTLLLLLCSASPPVMPLPKELCQYKLNQRSDCVVIIDSACHTQEDGVQGYLVISVWVSEATGADSGNGTCKLYYNVDISITSSYHLRVEMRGSPLDRVHKNGIGKALVSGQRGQYHWKSPVWDVSGNIFRDFNARFSLQQASMATRNEPCAPLLKALQQRLRAVLHLFMNYIPTVYELHPNTARLPMHY
eukprot:897723-Pelagomonas_calceolata.AAC.1